MVKVSYFFRRSFFMLQSRAWLGWVVVFKKYGIRTNPWYSSQKPEEHKPLYKMSERLNIFGKLPEKMLVTSFKSWRAPEKATKQGLNLISHPYDSYNTTLRCLFALSIIKILKSWASGSFLELLTAAAHSCFLSYGHLFCNPTRPLSSHPIQMLIHNIFLGLFPPTNSNSSIPKS